MLGGGFGGLETCVALAEALGSDPAVEIVLVDRSDAFVAGSDHVDVLAGAVRIGDVRRPYSTFIHPGVRFLTSDVHRINPNERTVVTAEGTMEADVIVVALGAELDAAATPGLAEDGHEFYSVPGVVAARRALASFNGGRVVVGVCGVPYKCPPAPSAVTLAVCADLVARHIRDACDLTLVMPTPRPIMPSPEASDAVVEQLASESIGWMPGTVIERLDPSRHVAVSADGAEIGYDLFLGVPVHRVPDVVATAGLCVDGWVRVDPVTMQTEFPGVYALGDVVDIGAPKAGVFAQAQARVVAAQVVAGYRGSSAPARGMDRGVCYLDIGAGRTTGIDVSFTPGGNTEVVLRPPSAETTAASVAAATERIERWFPGGG